MWVRICLRRPNSVDAEFVHQWGRYDLLMAAWNGILIFPGPRCAISPRKTGRARADRATQSGDISALSQCRRRAGTDAGRGFRVNLKIWNDLPSRWAALSRPCPARKRYWKLWTPPRRQRCPAWSFADSSRARCPSPSMNHGAGAKGSLIYTINATGIRWPNGSWSRPLPSGMPTFLDSGPTSYELEEIASRITNPQLAANPNLKPEAVILREGRVFDTVPLAPDPQSFTFRGNRTTRSRL